MNDKASENKRHSRLLFSPGKEVFAALTKAATDNTTTPQDLLGRAAQALINCQKKHGFIPEVFEISDGSIAVAKTNASLTKWLESGAEEKWIAYRSPDGTLFSGPQSKAPPAVLATIKAEEDAKAMAREEDAARSPKKNNRKRRAGGGVSSPE